MLRQRAPRALVAALAQYTARRMPASATGARRTQAQRKREQLAAARVCGHSARRGQFRVSSLEIAMRVPLESGPLAAQPSAATAPPGFMDLRHQLRPVSHVHRGCTGHGEVRSRQQMPVRLVHQAQ